MSNIVPPFTVIPSDASPDTFLADGIDFLGELPAFVEGVNGFADLVNARSSDASATTLWVSGTDYTEGQTVFSPADKKSYRAKNDVENSVTDPSVDETNFGVAGGVSAADQTKLSNITVTGAVNLDTLAAKRTRIADGGGSTGDLLVRQSDGTVTAVESSVEGATVGTSADASAITIGFLDSCQIGGNRHLFFYRNDANSAAYVIVGQFDGESWSFGTQVTIYASSVNAIRVSYDEENERAIVVWQDGASKHILAKALRFVGTEITQGSQTTIEASNTSQLHMDVGGGKIVCIYAIGTAEYAHASSFSDLTITAGTKTTLTSAGSIAYTNNVTWMPDASLFAIAYCTEFYQFYLNTISVSGTTITFGAELYIISATNTVGGTVHGCEISTNTLFVCFDRRTTGNGKVAAVALSGTSFVSIGTLLSISTDLFPSGLVLDPDSQKAIVLGFERSSGNFLALHTFTVSGSVCTEVEDIVLISSSITLSNVAYDTTNNAVIFSYNNSAGNDFASVNSFSFSSIDTNVGDWLGFALEDFTDAQAVEISTPGDFIGGFTGLTYDAEYYADADGTLTVTETSYGKVGRAVSTTEIIQTGPVV